jgi:solute carrier family 35 protein F1/2
MYPFAYVVIILGIATYYTFPTPEPSIGTFDNETAERERRELMGESTTTNSGSTDVESQRG